MFDNEDILNDNHFDFCKYAYITQLEKPPQYTATAQFLIIWGVLQFGLFFGFLLTAWIYTWTKHLGNATEENFIPEEIPYEKKYQVTYVDGCDKIPSENTYLCENTPDGMVFMNYCQKDEGFAYWADKNIRFSYLETAARKFVNQFGCTQLYIERECNKEVESDVEDDNDNIEENEKVEQEKVED